MLFGLDSTSQELIDYQMNGRADILKATRRFTKIKFWGGLVPYGKVWRTGSDEATLLVTQQPIELGGAVIPTGAYSLYTLLTEDGSLKLIVNKEVGQWGINRDGSTTRNEKSDVAQIVLTKESLDQPIDQFTIALTKGTPAGGVLIIAWEKTKYSVAFTVKK